MNRRTPRSPLFPYTTLFRSERLRPAQVGVVAQRRADAELERELERLGRLDGPHEAIELQHAERERRERRSEEHTSELQSRRDLVCRLLLEKKKNKSRPQTVT